MDLEALGSLEQLGKEEAIHEQVEKEEVPLVPVKEAQPSIPEELSPRI